MERNGVFRTVTATSSASTSGRIDKRGGAFGGVLIPTSVTQIDWYAAASNTGTAGIVDDIDGDPVITTNCVAGHWVPIPDECMGMPFLVAVLTGSSSVELTVFLMS